MESNRTTIELTLNLRDIELLTRLLGATWFGYSSRDLWKSGKGFSCWCVIRFDTSIEDTFLTGDLEVHDCYGEPEDISCLHMDVTEENHQNPLGEYESERHCNGETVREIFFARETVVQDGVPHPYTYISDMCIALRLDSGWIAFNQGWDFQEIFDVQYINSRDEIKLRDPVEGLIGSPDDPPFIETETFVATHEWIRVGGIDAPPTETSN